MKSTEKPMIKELILNKDIISFVLVKENDYKSVLYKYFTNKKGDNEHSVTIFKRRNNNDPHKDGAREMDYQVDKLIKKGYNIK